MNTLKSPIINHDKVEHIYNIGNQIGSFASTKNLKNFLKIIFIINDPVETSL